MLVNLNEVLYDAQKNHYGVGLFNTIDTDMLEAVISAAEELNSPVILGTAEVLLPYGELSLTAPSLIAAAKRAKVPVVVHFDHGVSFERCMEALKLGYSSIMFDGSASDIEENLRATREVVKIAHTFGASVEGEIGHVGQAANGDNDLTDMYTTPEEAISFVEATGVDALAIAIGTAHGAYKSKPKLDIERLKKISESAAAQCGRSIIPEVRGIIGYAEAIKEISEKDIGFICYEGDGTLPIKTLLTETPQTIGFLIGPEGGLSERETATAKENGISLAGLGKRILRTETASSYVLSAISVLLEM